MAYGLTQSVHTEQASNEYLSRSDSFGISSAGTHTFEAWIKLDTLPSSGQDWGIWTLAWETIGLRLWYLNESGTRRFRVMCHGWQIQQLNYTYDVELSTDTWYHVAYTYNGNHSEFFLNGVEVASANIGNGTGQSQSNPSTLGASYGNNSLGTTWNGNISLARVWNDVRTEAEIADNMCNVFGGAEAGLVAEWSLDNVYTSVPSNTYPWTANNTPTFESEVPAICAVVGPVNLKSRDTNLKANIKTIDTNPIANVKSLDTNT